MMYFFHYDQFRQWQYYDKKIKEAKDRGYKSLIEGIFKISKEKGIEEAAKVFDVTQMAIRLSLKTHGLMSCFDFKRGGSACEDLTGRMFGLLLPLRRYGNSSPVKWKCLCNNCGKIIIVDSYVLKRVQSPKLHCGCLPRNNKSKGVLNECILIRNKINEQTVKNFTRCVE